MHWTSVKTIKHSASPKEQHHTGNRHSSSPGWPHPVSMENKEHDIRDLADQTCAVYLPVEQPPTFFTQTCNKRIGLHLYRGNWTKNRIAIANLVYNCPALLVTASTDLLRVFQLMTSLAFSLDGLGLLDFMWGETGEVKSTTLVTQLARGTESSCCSTAVDWLPDIRLESMGCMEREEA